MVIINQQSTQAPWFSMATYFEGLAEVHGSIRQSQITEMLSISGAEVLDDRIPWAGAFVTTCLRLSGYAGSQGGARGFEHFGKDVADKPARGCVVVLAVEPEHTANHVGFLDREDGDEVLVV